MKLRNNSSFNNHCHSLLSVLVRRVALVLVLVLVVVVVGGPSIVVLAEEQTCQADDGTCTTEEQKQPTKACQDGHDQCEFWGSVGT